MSDAEGSMRLSVTPAATGPQIVRAALPWTPGQLGPKDVASVRCGGAACPTATRVLTRHADAADPTHRSARRAMVTWLHDFASRHPVDVRIDAVPAPAAPPETRRAAVSVDVRDDTVTLSWHHGPTVDARLIAPERVRPAEAVTEVVEDHELYHWRRVKLADRHWPRVIEVRVDALGQVVLVGHVRRDEPGNDYAPDLGWVVELHSATSRLAPLEPAARSDGAASHVFTDGESCRVEFNDLGYAIEHPAAVFRRKGSVALERGVDGDAGRTRYRYLRAECGDRTPMQQAGWLRFELVIGPAALAAPRPTLESPHVTALAPRAWDAIYRDVGAPPPLDEAPQLAAMMADHRRWLIGSAAVGDDWGNVTAFRDDQRGATVFGMNRLNHAPAIFAQAWRSGDLALLDMGVLWCENFHDQSIWWGAHDTGGTRYNNAPTVGEHPPRNDPGHYLWRSNTAVNFCTKGYDTFLLAYEQTGDPRMLEALDAQVAYASEHVHADRGETRNVGDVRDFLNLYHCTGETPFLDQALRLFRELRTQLWDDALFAQNGQPRSESVPFIDDDDTGGAYGYAKPYIIGYALIGLPALLDHAPNEPRLRDVVQAVADFLVRAQDPAGGWRYPHPRSSTLMLANLETAWELVQADRVLGADAGRLDAIERVLRARVQGWLRTGRVLTAVGGWERATGLLESTGKTMTELYASPDDRDPQRDYDEGDIALGVASPEALVYLDDLLRHYLAHRPASRLLAPPGDDEPLGRILKRLPDKRAYQCEGVRDNLPTFHERVTRRMDFPLSWRRCTHRDFSRWRSEARAKVIECLLAPPPAATFAPQVLFEEDRGTHIAQRIAFNLTGDSRVLAHLLVPKGDGPFPAVLLLHDHGARFDIGKEKVIAPLRDQDPRRIDSAHQWVEQCYGGRFVGDELARAGYVCMATDMLNWSDRGGGGYDAQQALAANLLHMGQSFAGLIAHEDRLAAEFLATRPMVDADRVAAMGLSVGGYRTWQLAALSDRIRAGVSVCWMATIAGQMQPGVNQTTGQSAFTMVHPALAAHLDFPDVASSACPKPMLFYNGLRDGLFDPDDVRRAYAILRDVWDAQGWGERLTTKLWDAAHVFDGTMQDEAFEWLDMAWRGR